MVNAKVPKYFLGRLDDLIKQAETEKSHYYTASVLKECRAIIYAYAKAIEDIAKIGL